MNLSLLHVLYTIKVQAKGWALLLASLLFLVNKNKNVLACWNCKWKKTKKTIHITSYSNGVFSLFHSRIHADWYCSFIPPVKSFFRQYLNVTIHFSPVSLLLLLYNVQAMLLMVSDSLVGPTRLLPQLELSWVPCHKHSSRNCHSDTTARAADGDAAVGDLSRAIPCHADGGESSRLTSVPVHFTFRAFVIQRCTNILLC